MNITKKEIVEKCKLSPSTAKLLEDMDEKTYKEIAREVIFLAKPLIEKQERERLMGWLKKYNDFNECGVERIGCGLLLTTKDYRALKEEK